MVFIDGHTERAMTHARCNQNQRQSKTFMAAVGAVPHVFKIKEDADDLKCKRVRKNSKGCNIKALCILTGDSVEENDVIDFCKKTPLPSILNIELVEINSESTPHLDKNFQCVSAWNQILTEQDVKRPINDVPRNCLDNSPISPGIFLRKDVSHATACFKPGTVAEDIKEDCMLEEKHLPEQDRKDADKAQTTL